MFNIVAAWARAASERSAAWAVAAVWADAVLVS